MERKIISIDISPDTYGENQTENAGLMWEHNATALVFNIHKNYVGEYRYYIEYRSLIGTKVRTEYLDLDEETNTVTYYVPVRMSSLKGVECYFNIVAIDGDGNTVQVIKPRKLYLQFDFSPDTDNSLAKVNDFSINALLEAIRLGTFKGDKGDTGEKGDKGEKGEKGDVGEISEDYAAKTFANAIKQKVIGNPIVVDNVSSLSHHLEIKTEPNEKVCIRSKNLIPFTNKKFNEGHSAGNTYGISGVNFTVNSDGSVTAVGTATDDVLFPLMVWPMTDGGAHTVTLSGSPKGASDVTYCLRLTKGKNLVETYEEYGNGKTIHNVDLSGCLIHIVVKNGTTLNETFYPMLEFGEIASNFSSPHTVYSAIADEYGTISNMISLSPDMCIFTNDNAEVTCVYNCDTEKAIEKSQKEVENQLESLRENFKNLNYRMINTVLLEKDSQSVTFINDTLGNALENLNLKKIFILFFGRFAEDTESQALTVSFNNGSAYQLYRTFNITAENLYGFWLESEKVAEFDEKTIYKSIYPSKLLSNFNVSTGLGQGLSGNNSELCSDLSIANNNAIKEITLSCFRNGNLMKEGSKIYLFGV